MRADAAEEAEDRLDEERRLDQPAVDEMRQRVEMADVVALDFEARAVLGAGGEDVGDVLEGVLEDAVVRAFEIGALPVVLELLETVQHRVETEIHRAHVERGDLGLEMGAGLQAFLDQHGRRAAGGDVDDAVRALLDHLEEGLEGLGRLVGLAGLRIAGMDMDERRAGLGRADGGVDDLIGRHRQIGRHGWRMDRAGDGAGDDDFAVLRHAIRPSRLIGLEFSPACAARRACAPAARRGGCRASRSGA